MRSLSSQLLVLTITFVMLAEISIFVPSVARFRLSWLNERLSFAHLAIVNLDVTDDRAIAGNVREELLSHVGAYAISIRRGGARLALATDTPPPVQATVDLNNTDFLTLTSDALYTLTLTEARVLRVVGPSPKDPDIDIEVIVEETPLRNALRDFAKRIFGLSIVISLVTASLVFLSLQWLMVRPMRQLTANMTAFREDPDDPERIMLPSDRSDEIGVAQRELASLQTELRAALRQKDHLAALGTAVAKVNHDLRGVLSTAVLLSDRLESSKDPAVQNIAPRLISTIERAVEICGNTLDYVRFDQPSINKIHFSLRELVEDVDANFALTGRDGPAFTINLRSPVDVYADRNQIFRVMTNLAKNAAEAGATDIEVSARNGSGVAEILVSDNGPGLPERARSQLFQPFKGSVRAGGTGLGLTIAREIMRHHGGDLTLEKSDNSGTTFALVLPKR